MGIRPDALPAAHPLAPTDNFMVDQGGQDPTFGTGRVDLTTLASALESGIAGAAGIKHHLVSGDAFVVPFGYEYFLTGPFTIDVGASITLVGEEARLVVL